VTLAFAPEQTRLQGRVSPGSAVGRVGCSRGGQSADRAAVAARDGGLERAGVAPVIGEHEQVEAVVVGVRVSAITADVPAGAVLFGIGRVSQKAVRATIDEDERTGRC
jgi:hypothetical protein